MTRSMMGPPRTCRTSCNFTRSQRTSAIPTVRALTPLAHGAPQAHHADTAALANGGFDRTTNSYPAKLGEVLDIVIQNIAGQTSGMAEAHPWHAHGEKYWDMGHGPGNFSYAALDVFNANRTGKPYLRDTSVAYPSPGASYLGQAIDKGGAAGWRLFRIRVTDPGLWLIHCHIAPHQVMGMMTMFLYGVSPARGAGTNIRLTVRPRTFLPSRRRCCRSTCHSAAEHSGHRHTTHTVTTQALTSPEVTLQRSRGAASGGSKGHIEDAIMSREGSRASCDVVRDMIFMRSSSIHRRPQAIKNDYFSDQDATSTPIQ